MALSFILYAYIDHRHFQLIRSVITHCPRQIIVLLWYWSPDVLLYCHCTINFPENWTHTTLSLEIEILIAPNIQQAFINF